MNQAKQPMKRRNWILWVIVGLLVISSLAFGAWKTGNLPIQQAQAQPTAPTYQTSAVRRGNISLSIAGTGKTVASQTVNLGFMTQGIVGTINVQVGDQVTKGQVLATLDSLDALKSNIDRAQADLLTAQQNLQNLTSEAQTALAQANADQAQAQITYTNAQADLSLKQTGRCAQQVTEEFYFQWLYAKKAADIWESALSNPKTGYGYDYIIKNLTPLRLKRDQAYANWLWCQGYTDIEIQTSQSNFQMAEANLNHTQAVYQTLEANHGIDPTQLAIAQAAVNSASLQLAVAQDNLAGANLVAPIDGAVTAISGTAGQAASGVNFITLVDLTHPMVQVNIDETDLLNFSANCPAQITFTALPNQTFSGTVAQVLPVLGKTNNVSSAQGLVQVNKDSPVNTKTLPLGMSASVEITCQSASNALLAPKQAIYQSGSSAFVYVLAANGKPEKRSVKVGLETTLDAEILSGLNAGERVITSSIKAP